MVQFNPQAGAIPRALALIPATNELLMGSTANQITRMSLYPHKSKNQSQVKVLVSNHASRIEMIAVHPLKNEYLTIGYDRSIKLWRADDHDLGQLLYEHELDDAATCVDFHPLGQKIACGIHNGQVLELDVTQNFQRLSKFHISGNNNIDTNGGRSNESLDVSVHVS